MIHDDGVHADERIPRDARAMNDGSMADVRRFLQHHGHAGEGVNGTVLLDVAPIGDVDPAPVPAQRRSWSDVHVATDDHVSRDCRLGVNERRFMNDGREAAEGIDHLSVTRD